MALPDYSLFLALGQPAFKYDAELIQRRLPVSDQNDTDSVAPDGTFLAILLLLFKNKFS